MSVAGYLTGGRKELRMSGPGGRGGVAGIRFDGAVLEGRASVEHQRREAEVRAARPANVTGIRAITTRCFDHMLRKADRKNEISGGE